MGWRASVNPLFFAPPGLLTRLAKDATPRSRKTNEEDKSGQHRALLLIQSKRKHWTRQALPMMAG
jgi:hypothetical protein